MITLGRVLPESESMLQRTAGISPQLAEVVLDVITDNLSKYNTYEIWLYHTRKKLFP